MIYRVLPEDERDRVAHVFAEHASMLPKNGFIIVGEENGEIVMLQCCHQVIHAGPVWIHPDLRGNGHWATLQAHTCAEMAKRGIQKFYQFGTDANESQLKRLGLNSLGWSVWLGEVS